MEKEILLEYDFTNATKPMIVLHNTIKEKETIISMITNFDKNLVEKHPETILKVVQSLKSQNLVH